MPVERKPVKADCSWATLERRLRAVLAGPCGGRCMDDSRDVEETVRELMTQFETSDQA